MDNHNNHAVALTNDLVKILPIYRPDLCMISTQYHALNTSSYFYRHFDCSKTNIFCCREHKPPNDENNVE